EVPGNVVATWFRYEEAAYLLGFAAAQMLPEGSGGTLGFITPAFDTRSERQRLSFTAGARAARPEVAVAAQALTATDGGTREELAASTAATLYDERDAGVIFITAGVPAEPVLRAAQQRLRLVAGIGPPLSRGAPQGLEPFVLATAHARLELGLSIPLTRYLDGWQGGVVSLGLADEALVLTPGGSVRWNEVRDAVADLRARVERGEVAVT
ncbi:MAG TPA: BMP family ABC transporter substrate-binding protein, partial [Nitriliruptorales bacterium]